MICIFCGKEYDKDAPFHSYTHPYIEVAKQQLAIYKFEFEDYCVNLYGIFVSDQRLVNYLKETGQHIYFGEVAGKHSEVSINIDDEIILISDKPENVRLLDDDFNITVGYNPVSIFMERLDHEQDIQDLRDYIDNFNNE